MSSILTNASALSALQSLTQTQSALQSTEKQVSTGLAVSTAADNASYWSIATQLNADSGVVTAANSALSQSQSVLSTASSAISSIVTTIQSIQTALTEATNPGADIGNLNTTLAQLGQQLTDAVSGASFNGLNVLDGSQASAAGALPANTLAFVSGFNATAAGGTINTINLTTQALFVSSATTTANANAVAASGILQGGTGSAAGSETGPTGNATTTANALDLTSLGTGTEALGSVVGTSAATQATQYLSQVATTLNQVTNYAAQIGATQDRMTAASTFNSALTTNYATGVSALVDADMNTASTRLQALQTQEQLGIQSLSIANQNSQLILKLFS
jgi:flagellin